MEEITQITRTQIIELNPKNFRKWLTEIKGHATVARVWNYVDPDSEVQMPVIPVYPRVSDFQIPQTTAEDGQAATRVGATVAATRYDQLTADQKDSYRFMLEEYKHEEKEATRIEAHVGKIRSLVLESARTYIPDTKFSSSARDILRSLQTRYQKDDEALIQSIHETYAELQDPTNAPKKDEIEKWIAQWENLREEIISQELQGSFSELSMTTDFLRAGSAWAPEFCANWA